MGSAMATWSVMPILQSLRNSWDSPCLTCHIFEFEKQSQISDSFFLGVLPRSMSSHDPLQRFFRRLLPVGRFGHGGVHDHTCGHNSSVVGSLKMPTEAMENGIILDDSY